MSVEPVPLRTSLEPALPCYAGDPAGHVFLYVLQLVPLWAVSMELFVGSGQQGPDGLTSSVPSGPAEMLTPSAVSVAALRVGSFAAPSSSEDEGSASEQERMGLLPLTPDAAGEGSRGAVSGGSSPLPPIFSSPQPHSALSLAPLSSPRGTLAVAATPESLLRPHTGSLPLLPLSLSARALLVTAEALVFWGTFTTVSFFHLPSETAASLAVGAAQAAATAALVSLAHRGTPHSQLALVWMQRAAAAGSAIYTVLLVAAIAGLSSKWAAGVHAPRPASVMMGVLFDAAVLALLWLGLLRSVAAESVQRSGDAEERSS